MDCESLFLKLVSVKKGNFDREAAVKTMSNSHLKKKDEQNISMQG